MADHLAPFPSYHIFLGNLFPVGKSWFWVVGRDPLPEMGDDVEGVVGWYFASAEDRRLVEGLQRRHISERTVRSPFPIFIVLHQL